jgi:GrpB-like predicted nucleotidyltransferase (UPF0157 family)
MLGLERGTVEVVPYTTLWASLFHHESKRLADTLGSLALDIQHIGSTSVPGLAAKPILDVGIMVAKEEDVAKCVPLLTTLGYSYRGDRGLDQGHFFDRGSEQHLTHYLHMLMIGSQSWQNYLRFRDYLIAHPATRDRYMQLKQELAIQFATDRAAYTAAKAQFIQQILSLHLKP